MDKGSSCAAWAGEVLRVEGEHSIGLGRRLPDTRRSRLNNRKDKEAYDPNGTFGRFLFGFGVWATR